MKSLGNELNAFAGHLVWEGASLLVKAMLFQKLPSEGINICDSIVLLPKVLS